MNYVSKKISAPTLGSRKPSTVSAVSASPLAADPLAQTSYGQFMSLFAKTVAERTRPGQRQDVEEKCALALIAQTQDVAQ